MKVEESNFVDLFMIYYMGVRVLFNADFNFSHYQC